MTALVRLAPFLAMCWQAIKVFVAILLVVGGFGAWLCITRPLGIDIARQEVR